MSTAFPHDSSSASGADQPRGILIPASGSGAPTPVVRHMGTAGESADPPGLHPIITPGVILRAVGRRWPQAVALGLVLAACFAAGAWVLRPDKFTAYALLRVASSEQKILHDPTRDSDANGVYSKTQLALLRSRPVLRAALRNEKIRQLPIVLKQSDPVEWLEKELKAEQILGTEIIRLSLTVRGDGNDLAAIVNAITEAYLAEVVRGEHAAQLAHLDDLQKVYAAAEDKLRHLRESVHSLTRDLKGGDSKILTLKQQTILDEYAALKRELAATKTRCRDLDIKISTHKLRLEPGAGKAQPGMDAVLVERELEADPQVRAAEQEVAKLQELLKQYEATAANPRASYKLDVQRRLDAETENLRKVRESRRVGIAARYQTISHAGIAQTIREAEAERSMLQKQDDALQAEVAGLKKELDRLGLSSVELELRRSEIERSEQFLRAIWEQKERIEVELKGSGQQRVTLVASAEEATVLNKLGRFQETAAAGFGGLCVGLFAVGYYEHRRGRVHSTKDISRGLRLRVLGSLPRLPGDGSLAAIGSAAGSPAEKYRRGLTESVDGIRTRFLHEYLGDHGAVLMVASAESGEGKTTLAAQLAASFARARRRTLLVDCDLRAPSLHATFGVPRGPGVCDLFRGTAPLTKLIQTTPFDHLDFLPAGDFSAEVVDGLTQTAALYRLFDELRNQYDFVVIDSSPLLLVPDALMIARYVDGLLFSIRPGFSQMANVYAAYERMSDYHLPFIGVVANGVRTDTAYAQGYDEPASQKAPSTTETPA